MNNVLILPIILPLITGMLLIIFREKIILQRVFSLLAVFLTGTSAVILLKQIQESGIQTLQLGGWEAPFGIGLVGDFLSVLLILTSSIVALCCLLYSFRSIGEEREKHFFYPLFLFLLTGVNGSFLTGDLFNLYVFFEVLLIASYVLVSLGGKKFQLREGIKYVVINVVSSSFFLVAIAYLYSVTGTLSMAHISVRVAEVGQDGFMTVIALLFLMVFATKAALFLFYWLPGSYSAPPTAIAAVFAALLTKVGIYAIFRMFSLIFYHEPQITHITIGVLAALTMILGGMGAIGYWDIKKILTYNVILGSGFILAGFAAFSTEALTGSIFYLMHDMIIKALIFLIGGAVIALTGTQKLQEMSGLIRTHPKLGWMFFIAALSISGIPPFSGFVGKVFVTKGTFEMNLFWLGIIGLFSSLLILYSMVKIFMNAFWGETILSEEEEKGTDKGLLFPIFLLTLLTILLGVFAEGLVPFIEQAAEGLMNPEGYINAVFNGNPIP